MAQVFKEVLNDANYEKLDREITVFTTNLNRNKWNVAVLAIEGFVNPLSHEQIEETLMLLPRQKIFLFGYMKILSKEVCEKHDIYNLHPGDIIKYPELKGKDPIEKYFNNYGNHGPEKTHELGCVIHKVTAEVDEGPVLLRQNYEVKNYEQAVIESGKVAISMWKQFITQIL